MLKAKALEITKSGARPEKDFMRRLMILRAQKERKVAEALAYASERTGSFGRKPKGARDAKK